MNILVINAGSSSLKYQLIDVVTEKVLAKGLCERVGSRDSFHKHGIDEREVVIDTLPARPHGCGRLRARRAHPRGIRRSIQSRTSTRWAHRVVQGQRLLRQIGRHHAHFVVDKIRELAELAPLHNMAALAGIRPAPSCCPMPSRWRLRHVVLSDAAAQGLHVHARPCDLYERYGIRKYGAHGTSHHLHFPSRGRAGRVAFRFE